MTRDTALRPALVLVLAVVVLTGAGCGGSSDDADVADPAVGETTTSTADEWPYTVDDYVAQLEEEPSSLTDVMADAEAQCFVRSVVESIGLDRLSEAGITPEQFAAADDFDERVASEEEGRAITIDALVGCTDFHELVLAQAGLPAADAQCLRDQVEERDLAEVLLGTTSGEYEPTAEAEAAYDAAVAACPEAMQALGDG